MVNVGTNKPFSGRIYALGRSETCNVDVINSDTFRLDLTMAGQDCNTQSAVSLSFVSMQHSGQSSLISSAGWCLYQHCRGPETQRRHDQDGQDLQGPLYVRHQQQEHHLRHDAHPGPRHDQHNLRARGARTQDPDPGRAAEGGGDREDRRQAHLQDRDPREDAVRNLRQVSAVRRRESCKTLLHSRLL